MDNEDSAGHNALKRLLLDGTAEPMPLPLSLLLDITNSFSDDRQIGMGGFAVVYKGIVGEGMVVAVKKLTKTYNLEEKKFYSELECLVKAKHKNVVRFLGYCAEIQAEMIRDDGKFIMADIRKWLLCFEYVPNGSLKKYITDASRGLKWTERYEIIKGICEGLRNLHDKHILHLDIKPDNVLIDDHMIPKITDFGLSRCLSDEQTHVFSLPACGTWEYIAPEVFKGHLTSAADIYSLGMVIMELLTGKRGYPEDENVVESWRNRLEDMQLEQVKVCHKIGMECLEGKPEKRPDINHILDRLDKTTSIVEMVTSGSSVEHQVSLIRHRQEIIRNTPEDEIKDVAQQLEIHRNDQCQEKEDQWSIRGLQDTNQDQRHTSISCSNSGVFEKLSNLDIFDRKSHRNFIRNGGHTIQESNSVMIFREEELKTILNIRNLVGRGGFGEVYEGILGERLVAVRKPIAGSLLQNEQFANEVIQQSQVIHENIVRLIGCCLEVDIPILVYEFFSNGSLDDILHSNSKVPLNLGMRLRIAAQAADGIAVMHSRTDDESPFFDLGAANILLDDNFVPKISGFGISRWRDKQILGYFTGRSAPRDYFVGRPAELIGAYFIGRPADFGISKSSSDNQIPRGYFVGRPANQQFLEDNQLTQESDVCKFGIIILELISRKKATGDDNGSLVKDFLNFHAKGKKATTLFDKAIAGRRDLGLLHSLVEIAVECLSIDVTLRPKMTEVAERLLRLSRKYTG